MFTLADLMTPETQDVIAARLLANLTADGQPTASWAPASAGGAENLRLSMVAAGLAQWVALRVANITKGGILPLATDSPDNGYWLTYLGKKFYGLKKRQATSTIQNLALYNPAGAAPVSETFQVGDVIAKAPSSGNLYRSISTGQFTKLNTWKNYPLIIDPTVDNPLMLQVQAESPGSAFDDPAGTIITMVTAFAGIRCVNIRPTDFTPVRHSGVSSGGMVGSWASPATPPTLSVIRVRIDASGNVGSARASISIDGGATWASIGLLPSTYAIAGAVLTFTGGAVSPSFVQGDVMTVIVQDSILQRGADAETDPAFIARVSNRWPALSAIPVKGTIELWAHLASDEVNKVRSDADPTTPGGILVTIASSSGPASPTAVVAVEDYILARLQGYKGVPAPSSPVVPGSPSPQETALVQSAAAFNVAAAAIISVPKDKLATAQVQAQDNWDAYIRSLPLGGDPGAVVELANFEDILADVGATDVQSLTLNGVASDLAIPVGGVAVAGVLLTSCVWVPV